MTAIVSKNPMVKQIAEGSATPELIDMTLKKQMPFTEEEYLESLVFLLTDENHKNTALTRLKEISEIAKGTYIEKTEASPRVAYFVLVEALGQKDHATVAKAIRNQALPYEYLLKIAIDGDADMLEALLDNTIKMIAYPEILDEVEKNPETNNFIRGKITEIRDFYLTNLVEDIPEEAVMDDVKELVAMEQEKAKKAPPESKEEEEEDELLELEQVEEKALTMLQEINRMSISQRVKLAFKGSKTQRLILIKDSNKMVSLSVLESPKIGVDEVTLMCKNRSLPGEMIAKISRRRDWTKNYAVMYELIHNPKTPVKDALSFVKKLHMRDLQLVSRDKNVSPVIRQLAMNFFKQKSGIKK